TVNGNIYLLRGFFLDHGTDFSLWIDDVPYNEPNHPHLHGFLDVNSMIPELVQTIDFKKGVYYPEAGDFSSAATARIALVDSLPYGIFKSEFGKDSYVREVVANSDRLGPGVLLYTMGDADDGFRATAIGYSAVGRTNDALPLAAIEAGQIDRFGASDPFE